MVTSGIVVVVVSSGSVVVVVSSGIVVVVVSGTVVVVVSSGKVVVVVVVVSIVVVVVSIVVVVVGTVVVVVVVVGNGWQQQYFGAQLIYPTFVWLPQHAHMHEPYQNPLPLQYVSQFVIAKAGTANRVTELRLKLHFSSLSLLHHRFKFFSVKSYSCICNFIKLSI